MARNDEDILLDRLLAGRDAPSVTDREHLWERLNAATVRPRRSTWWVGLLPLGLGAAALMFFLVRPPEFGIRGGDRGSVAIRCLNDGAVSQCRPGHELVLQFTAPDSAPFVTAFIQDPAGLITWVTPSTAVRQTEPFAIRLAEQTPTGEGLAAIVFTPEAVDRETIRNGLESEVPERWQVFERPFTVLGGPP